MSELAITYCRLVHRPGDEFAGDCDRYRWHAWVAGERRLVVELNGLDAHETGLMPHEIEAHFRDALRRFAAERLGEDGDAVEQSAIWESPVALGAEHFR